MIGSDQVGMVLKNMYEQNNFHFLVFEPVLGNQLLGLTYKINLLRFIDYIFFDSIMIPENRLN